jgi:hypothetical protein
VYRKVRLDHLLSRETGVSLADEKGSGRMLKPRSLVSGDETAGRQELMVCKHHQKSFLSLLSC